MTDLSSPLVLRHRPWETPLTRPAMSNSEDRHQRVAITSRYVERDGRPYIPVSGEFHFSRVPRREWERRLRLLVSGGVNTVAAYVIWIHHQPTPEDPRFDENRDVAAFIELCGSLGLDVVLRIGPWCHGEVRNGGFPDWVQEAPVAHRTDDPGYLALVRPWLAALGSQLSSLCGPDSPITGIQIENELYDQAGHIATLKHLARNAGLTAPLWMATAWGGAELPGDEVLPMFGGYADGFWVAPDAPWDYTFREHFFFSHVWDDPGIGADVRKTVGVAFEPDPRSPSEAFPPVTCELGGGMATAYHRRPLLTGDQIAAVANNKLGNGSAWQGYYMYAGGLNPAPDMQESHATGYPNDMPQFDYDFHAPVGASGRTGQAHAPLRLQHAFLSAVGDRLAQMPSTLPEVLPSGVDDARTLRWAVRSNGTAGFVFVTMCQPHEPLDDIANVQFQIELHDQNLVFPQEPVTIPAGTVARWPFGFATAGPELRWATASLVTVLEEPGQIQTVVLAAEKNVPVELAFAPDTDITSTDELCFLEPGIVRLHNGRTILTAGGVRFLVLSSDDAAKTWVLDVNGARQLLVSSEELTIDGSDLIVTSYGARSSVEAFDRAAGRFAPLSVPQGLQPERAETQLIRPATAPLSEYGEQDGRPSAPGFAEIDERAARFSLQIPDWASDPGTDAVLEIEWTGDVAVLSVDGVKTADRFGDGSLWTVNLRDIAPTGGSLEIQILPLALDTRVWLPAGARTELPGAEPAVSVSARRRTEHRSPLPTAALAGAR
ncbi:beta-galactosidase [Arthrobacter sp. R3-55]